MPVVPTYPGLYVEELPSSSHAITAAPMSIAVFVGYTHPYQGECAENGLWGDAIRIFNFADYERYFGGLYRSTFVDWNVSYSVYQFFLNGGTDAWVVALKPRYYDRSSVQPAEDIEPASGNLSGIAFTSRELTDSSNPVRITISRARPSTAGGATNDMADLLVAHSRITESYRGVKTDGAADPSTVTDPDFIARRLANSRLLRVSPQNTPSYPAAFTNGSLELSVMPPPSFAASGWTTFRALDFDGVFEANTSLDKVEIFNLLTIPGVADAGIWSTALAFCERKRAFLIIDPPPNASADGMGGLPNIEDSLGTLVPTSAANAAFYFPYLKTIDPLTSKEIPLPPSGYVAGVCARTDATRGVWKAPAGLETSLNNTTGVVDEGRMTDQRQGVLNPKGINVLRSFPGSGTVVWGARTTVTNSPAFEQWRYVPVRRTALWIEQTLVRNLGWVIFEPNDEPLWAAIRLSIENFMLSLFRQSAFQGRSPSEAFRVLCDKTTTLQSDIDLGIVNILVGFRPLKPAEFVIIKIAQLAGQAQA